MTTEELKKINDFKKMLDAKKAHLAKILKDHCHNSSLFDEKNNTIRIVYNNNRNVEVPLFSDFMIIDSVKLIDNYIRSLKESIQKDENTFDAMNLSGLAD